MPSKAIIIVTEFMFLGINIFWALLRAHFNPCLTARAKMSLSRAQNIFMPVNIDSIVLMYQSSPRYTCSTTYSSSSLADSALPGMAAPAAFFFSASSFS